MRQAISFSDDEHIYVCPILHCPLEFFCSMPKHPLHKFEKLSKPEDIGSSIIKSISNYSSTMNKTYFRKSYQEVFKDVPITNEMHLQNSFDLVAIMDNNNNSVSIIPLQRATVGGLKGGIEEKTEVIPMNAKEIGERLLRVLQDRSIFLPTAETAPQLPLNTCIPNTKPETIDVGDRILVSVHELICF